MAGKLITFEGIDGSGKTTQIRMLSGEFQNRGIDAVLTREPGGTPLGRQLRSAFLETEETVEPLAELLLFAADRAQHVNLLIRPAMAAGRIVLSDRFSDATFAYQGAGRGFARETVEQVISLATSGLKPDLTIFIDAPIEVALSRAKKTDESRIENRMDTEGASFYERVRDSYLSIAESEPDRFRVVNGYNSIEEVQSEIQIVVFDFLKNNDHV